MNETEQDVIDIVIAVLFSTPVIMLAIIPNYWLRILLPLIQGGLVYALLRNISFLNRRLGLKNDIKRIIK